MNIYYQSLFFFWLVSILFITIVSFLYYEVLFFISKFKIKQNNTVQIVVNIFFGIFISLTTVIYYAIYHIHYKNENRILLNLLVYLITGFLIIRYLNIYVGLSFNFCNLFYVILFVSLSSDKTNPYFLFILLNQLLIFFLSGLSFLFKQDKKFAFWFTYLIYFVLSFVVIQFFQSISFDPDSYFSILISFLLFVFNTILLKNIWSLFYKKDSLMIKSNFIDKYFLVWSQFLIFLNLTKSNKFFIGNFLFIGLKETNQDSVLKIVNETAKKYSINLFSDNKNIYSFFLKINQEQFTIKNIENSFEYITIKNFIQEVNQKIKKFKCQLKAKLTIHNLFCSNIEQTLLNLHNFYIPFKNEQSLYFINSKTIKNFYTEKRIIYWIDQILLSNKLNISFETIKSKSGYLYFKPKILYTIDAMINIEYLQNKTINDIYERIVSTKIIRLFFNSFNSRSEKNKLLLPVPNYYLQSKELLDIFLNKIIYFSKFHKNQIILYLEKNQTRKYLNEFKKNNFEYYLY